MAIRQYIGARYVPLFAGAWTANTEYEALTIVTHNNSSYTSKKTVPANIGSPDNNPNYWANTGNYNSYIADLTQGLADANSRIDDTNDHIDDVENTVNNYNTATNERIDNVINRITNDFHGRKFIFEGDSYLLQSPNWGGLTALNLGLSNDQYTIIAAPGAGFITRGSQGRNFTEMLENEPIIGDITDIVVAGGANDRSISDPLTIKQGVIDYVERAKVLYPDARIWVAMPANSTTYDESYFIWHRSYYGIKQGAIESGVTFMDGVSYALQCSSDFLDYLHPNGEGSKTIAAAMSNILMGGDYIYSKMYSGDVTCSLDSNVPFSFRAQGEGSMIWYQLTPHTGSTRIDTSAAPFNTSASNFYELCDIPVEFINGYPVTTSILAHVRTGVSTWQIVGLDIRFFEGKVLFRMTEGLQDIQYMRFGQITACAPSRRG